MSAANAQAMRASVSPLAAVVEQGPRRRRGRCGVGDVVGQHLLGVGPTGLVQAAHGGGDDVVGQGDDLGGSCQVRRGGGAHETTLPTGTSAPPVRSPSEWASASPEAPAQAPESPAVSYLGAMSVRVGVFCGSNVGGSPEFLDHAQRLGSAIARRGLGLVYGGGHVGLMGAVADAVLEQGGEVVG